MLISNWCEFSAVVESASSASRQFFVCGGFCFRGSLQACGSARILIDVCRSTFVDTILIITDQFHYT